MDLAIKAAGADAGRRNGLGDHPDRVFGDPWRMHLEKSRASTPTVTSRVKQVASTV